MNKKNQLNHILLMISMNETKIVRGIHINMIKQQVNNLMSIHLAASLSSSYFSFINVLNMKVYITCELSTKVILSLLYSQ